MTYSEYFTELKVEYDKQEYARMILIKWLEDSLKEDVGL